MWKKEKQSPAGGDWSDTGTFVRKPATGWLHKESDLTSGAYVKYRLNYLGCVVIHESMRSLQYQLRTMVTREAISRLAEQSDKIPTKKRKVPNKVSKILGEMVTRFSGDVNLCIDVDQLAIYGLVKTQDVITHSLTTISFASGGEGNTQDFVGYVAKDRINDRACHVFHCPGGTAQLVLASLGQAFELRYKMYLGSSSQSTPQQQQQHQHQQHQYQPSPQPPSFNSVMAATSSSRHNIPANSPKTRRTTGSFTESRYYSSSDPPSYSNTNEVTDPLPPPLPIANMGSQNRRILPSDPPPLTEVTRQIQAPLPPPPTIAPQRPRVYSSLPGFPEPAELESSNQQQESQYEMEDNEIHIQPFSKDTPSTDMTPPSSTGTHTNRPLSYNPYDTMPENGTLVDNRHFSKLSVDEVQDDKDHDYDSVHEEDLQEDVTYDIVEGYEDSSGRLVSRPSDTDDIHLDTDLSLQQPQEEEYQLITIHQKPSTNTEDQIDLTPSQTPDATTDHVYSNLQDEFPISPRGPPVEADYDDPESLEMPPVIIKPTNPGEYDDPDAFIQQASIDLNSPDCPPPSYDGLMTNSQGNQPSPAFDDSIYSTPQSDFVEPQEDPYAPIHLQSYFHGQIPRARAESLVKEDGDFLVRESSNKPGQYVLTGLSNGRSQHLLLIDKSGKVKSKDREFESVPHLVKFFYDRATSLTIGNCEVFLTRPIIK